MPRSHVSVARFYDWTDDLGDCFSVSRLYREIANIPRLDSKGALRGSQPTLGGFGNGWANNGVGNGNTNNSASMINIASATGAVVHQGAKGRGHPQSYLSPGRMFVRDKKALTRGEREIIEGIYKNRGDVVPSSKDVMSSSEFHVRSHQEAWLVGKTGAVPCAYMADGTGGAMGRAIMKGVGLDTPNKSGNFKVCNGEHHYDILSRTPATSSSSDDTSSSNSHVAMSHKNSPREGKQQRRDRYSTLPTGKRPLASPEPTEHRESHEKVKRILHDQNPVDYWDSRPCAPPSSPTRLDLEESPPSTPAAESPILASRPNPLPFTHLGTLPPDKLLAMRPSLPPNAIILAEKIQSVPAPEKTNKYRTSNSGSSPQDMLILNGKVLNSGQYKEWSSLCETTSGGDAPGASDNRMNVDRGGLNNKDIDRPQNLFSDSDFDTMPERPGQESEKDRKKVQVRVYLPSMGTETNEDDVSILSTLTKERPLSETAFKPKGHGQDIKVLKLS